MFADGNDLVEGEEKMIQGTVGRFALAIFWYSSGGAGLKQQHEYFRNRVTGRTEHRTDTGLNICAGKILWRISPGGICFISGIRIQVMK